MLRLKRLRNGLKSCSTTAGRSKRQYRSDTGKRFTFGLGGSCETTSQEWGSCAGEQIPQIEELFSDRNGDGVFREENTKLPMLTIAVAVAIWTQITCVACKWMLMPERLRREA